MINGFLSNALKDCNCLFSWQKVQFLVACLRKSWFFHWLNQSEFFLRLVFIDWYILNYTNFYQYQSRKNSSEIRRFWFFIICFSFCEGQINKLQAGWTFKKTFLYSLISKNLWVLWRTLNIKKGGIKT